MGLKIVILLFCFSSLFGQIARDEALTGTQTTGTITFSPTGGNDRLWVVGIANKGDTDVSSVAGGGLSWTETIDACADGGQGGLNIWTAYGSAASPTITVTFASTPTSGCATLQTFTGVAATSNIEDIHWQNQYDGEGTANPGGCTAGDKTTPASFTVGNTTSGDWLLVFTFHRNTTVSSEPTGGWTGKQTTTQGTGGDQGSITNYYADRTGSTGDLAASIGFSSTDDWVTGGFSIVAAGGAEPGAGPRHGQIIMVQ